MKPFKNREIDKLILGCTHYPLFERLIKEELDEKVDVINTGEKLAKYLKKFIENNKLKNKLENNAKYKIYLTDTECNFIQVAEKLVRNKEIIKDIEKIDT